MLYYTQQKYHMSTLYKYTESISCQAKEVNMSSFLKFLHLLEAKQDEVGERKLAVFTFGRMNPPTRGHKKLIDAVGDVATNRGGDSFIFVSSTHDRKKNPLPYSEKVSFLQQALPGTNIINDPSVRTPFEASGYLSDRGYTDIVMVVGSDRVDEFRRRFSKSYEFFDSFEVVSAGERDPDAEGITGMSGTKAREAALTGNIGKFRAATGWEGELAYHMMQAVRRGMGVE
jgi:nicotinic acid mononucleotide adenylyltransferase